MDRGQVALKLFLDELGIDSSIETIDDRKRVQKAVYLGQLSGVDLGYRFGWYIKGPYSPGLTRDYFGIAEAEASGDEDWKGKKLREPIREKLRKISPLMKPPEGVNLESEDWLELVASLHFLRQVSGLNEAEALKILEKEKSHVFGYVEEAKRELLRAQLLPVS